MRIAAIVVVLHATTAHAQEPQEPQEQPQADVDVAPEHVASGFGAEFELDELRELRLQHRVQRRREGWSLAIIGALGVVGGSVMAIAGRDDSFYLAHGLTALSFGAINLPLGIALMDLGGGSLLEIENDVAGAAIGFDSVRCEAIRGQRGKRISFAVNTFLDVLYIVAGVLMIGLADRTGSKRGSEGAGWAMITQGGFLLGYDIYGWAASSRRIRQLEAL